MLHITRKDDFLNISFPRKLSSWGEKRTKKDLTHLRSRPEHRYDIAKEKTRMSGKCVPLFRLLGFGMIFDRSVS